MIQRLVLLCALVALASESAYGVGLGKLELHSALNQRLDADIALTNAKGLGIDEILPGLASAEEFDKVGIDRPYALTDLRFSVQQRDGGQMYVHITSTKPIVEPFLDFLVEVLWPNGRILREYTVLLDPPVFGKSGVQQLNVPQGGQMEKKAPAPGATPGAPPPTAARPQTPTRQVPTMTRDMEEGSVSRGEYGVTGPGDTLWTIALKVRPNDSVTVQQTMLAIKEANPDAFINNNINLLKAGRVLRIPDVADIRRESREAAMQEVQSQNAAFAAYKSGKPMKSEPVTRLDASRRQRQSSSSGSTGGGGELHLVAGETNASAAASTAKTASGDMNAQTQQLQGQLAAAQENLDKAKRANTDLNGRVSDLEDQIKTLNNLVKLKDQQLAALRSAVKKMQANPAPTPAVTTPPEGGSLLTNPYVLIGLGFLLVGGVAGGLIFMRRRGESEEFEAEEFDDEDISEGAEEEEPDMAVSALEVEEEDEELSPQTTDVIGEAEIYIAYGKFPQAITFLQNAIEAEPDRTDIQLKLLEVYVQTEDATAFNLQFERLRALGDQDAIAQARALQQKIPGASEAATEPEEDLSFDLDDLDAETEEDTFDLSGDLDLEESEEESLDASSGVDLEETEDMDLDLDLDDADLDLDLEASSEQETLEEDDEGAITLDENDLEGADLDLELETAAAELDDEIELDLDSDDIDLEGELDLGDDEDLAGEISLDDEDELNLDEDAGTKLDLARAYIDMGDSDGARTVLQEVIEEGSASEIQEANELLAKID